MDSQLERTVEQRTNVNFYAIVTTPKPVKRAKAKDSPLSTLAYHSYVYRGTSYSPIASIIRSVLPPLLDLSPLEKPYVPLELAHMDQQTSNELLDL